MPRRNDSARASQRHTRAHVRAARRAHRERRYRAHRAAGTLHGTARLRAFDSEHERVLADYAQASGQSGPLVFLDPDILRWLEDSAQRLLWWAPPRAYERPVARWLYARGCCCRYCHPPAGLRGRLLAKLTLPTDIAQGLEDWEDWGSG